jgi:CRISPR-associated endonuclease/helicase Cas3
MRPMHAAFLGGDSLVVLDEAHLVPPFQALIEQVRRLAGEDRERAPAPAPALRLMTLSATGRGTAAQVFTLEAEDETEDPVVRQRLDARKRLRVEAEVAEGKLAGTLAERAWARGEGGKRVVVFCNSRKVAQEVHKDLGGRLKAFLKERFGKDAPEVGRCLQMMVGARRVREREVLADSEAFKRFSPKTAAKAATAAEGLPAFLVATSAGAVGVVLDADHMVADLVSWERMVQRLGRVNRLGASGEGALVDIFPALSGKDKEAELAIDKDEKLATFRKPFDSPLWPEEADGRRDASPGMLRRLRALPEFAALAEEATSQAPLRPALTRPHVEAWSMTSLGEHPGRALVAPWIRGWVEEEPQTELVWRRYLPIRPDENFETARGELADFFDAAPPHLTEILETAAGDVARLLKDRAKAAEKAGQANRGEDTGAAPAGGLGPLQPGSIAAVILAADRTVERLVRLADLADLDERQIARRLLVLDARLGGLDGAGLLDAKAGAPPATLDDPEPSESPGPLAEGTAAARWSEARLKEIGYRVRRVGHDVSPDRDCRISYRRFVNAGDEETAEKDTTALEWRVESWVSNEPAQTRRCRTVDDHHGDVERWARRIGGRLGLPEADIALLARVALVHDFGKMRKNWQAYAGNPGYGRPGVKALAKFTSRGNPRLLEIGELTYRHEFGSLRDVLDQDLFDGLDPERRDLALHLVAAHHGNARPVITPADEKCPPSVNADLAREAALRFARLQRRWGPWGLAFWEALFRAADIGASREIDQPKTAEAAPSGPALLPEDP